MKRFLYALTASTITTAALFGLGDAPAQAICVDLWNDDCDIIPDTTLPEIDDVVVPATNSLSSYKLKIVNNSSHIIQVKVRYMNLSGRWITEYFNFSSWEGTWRQSESGSYVGGPVTLNMKTRNRYIYLSAKDSSGNFVWKEKEVDMGSTIKSFTYRFNE